MRQLLLAGADKVALNTAALQRPALIADGSDCFGAQCIVVAIDVKRSPHGWEVYSHGGRHATGRDAIEWARQAQALGAGEILATSIDRDGTNSGYDLQLVQALNGALSIPVIASGGVGRWEDVRDVFQYADAALMASIFHFGTSTVEAVKAHLHNCNVNVRL